MCNYETRIIKVDPDLPDLKALQPAALAILAGELVAFPTETVYGLGACATDPSAVSRIFAVKGRPQDNPLIVHVNSLEELTDLVDEIPPLARSLFAAFSPGPLTLILKRSNRLPGIVSADLATVAVRIPAHPVARALIDLAGVAIAAPSANRSGKPSPTLAWHVKQDLNGLIPYIVDGGPSALGLESSVIDVTGPVPLILRPGSITAEDVFQATGIIPERIGEKEQRSGDLVRSPGMKYRHYAPNARVLVAGDGKGQKAFKVLIEEIRKKGLSVGLYLAEQTLEQLDLPWQSLNLFAETPLIQPDVKADDLPVFIYGPEPDALMAGRHLFNALRLLDSLPVDVIIAEGLSTEGVGAAYMNRLAKAARGEPVPVAGHSKEIVFVCTGNTCRSPMAAALFRAKTQGLFFETASAGLAAMPGEPASRLAREVLADVYHLDLTGHRARPLDIELIHRADQIVTMTKQQKKQILSVFPELLAKVNTLGELAGQPDADVLDPFGLGYNDYISTARSLSDLIDRWLQQMTFSNDSNSDPAVR